MAPQSRAATTDDERRKLRLPRRQDLERDEPEAFMSVERLEVPRRHQQRPKLAARLVVRPRTRAARIVGGGHREGGELKTSQAAIFIDFLNLWVNQRRGRRRRRRRGRTGEARRLASRCRRCRSGTCTRCSRPSSRARCRRVMRASPDTRGETHALANSDLLTPCLLTPLPSSLMDGQPANRRGSRSPR